MLLVDVFNVEDLVGGYAGKHKERKKLTERKGASRYTLKVGGVQFLIFNPSAEGQIYLDTHQKEAKQHRILLMTCQEKHEVKGTSKTFGLADRRRREKKVRVGWAAKMDAPGSKGYLKSQSLWYQTYYMTLKWKIHCCNTWDASWE